MKTFKSLHQNQQGGARAKFIISVALFALVIYVGYMYIPVSVDAYYFKDEMQKKVDLGAAQGKDSVWVKDQLTKLGPEFHVPPDAAITGAQREGRLEVRVQFTRPISFPGYTYNYDFDHIVTSGSFLMK
ncbi:MAG TPA: hypothetical protein VE969_07300 [Pyrinomonadaceae bacterium]|nr:hypothetical protein [Pyrinomonadaceae bacterium]